MANPLFIDNLKKNSGEVAAGALALAGNYYGMANQSLNLDVPQGATFDAYGRPSYNLNSAWNQVSGSKPQGATGGDIFSGAAQGASIGTMLAPGIGTAIGAGVGAIGSAVFGGVRRRKQQREKNKAMRQLTAGQTQYNTADVNFRNSQNAMEDYRDSQDKSARLYNLHRNQY